MAAVAVRVRCGKGVVVAYVAIRAGHDFPGRLQLVRARKRPACRTVIKDGCIPCDRVMACRAVGSREGCSGRGMHGIIRLLPRRQVASGIAAVCRRDGQVVIVVDVAGSAGWHFATVSHQRVRIRQWKAKRVVVELAVGPLRDGMASRAGGRRRREARGNVIGYAPAE